MTRHILIVIAPTYTSARRHVFITGLTGLDWWQFEDEHDANRWLQRCEERGVKLNVVWTAASERKAA